MRKEEGSYRPNISKYNIENYTGNINKDFTNVLSGVIIRTHALMLSTFSYAQKIRVFGSNTIFDSLCRQYYGLSNTVQRLIEQMNQSGVETHNIYHNLARLSEVNMNQDDDDSFSEAYILNSLIGNHQNIITYITNNFNITSSKMNSELCEIIVERLNEHRRLINELNRLKNQIDRTMVLQGQLN
jgi:DNA-binding ferritin-like protein